MAAANRSGNRKAYISYGENSTGDYIIWLEMKA